MKGDQQNGHLCGSFLPPPQNTSSNALHIEFKTGAATSAGTGILGKNMFIKVKNAISAKTADFL